LNTPLFFVKKRGVLRKIISLKSAFSKGLSANIKAAYPDVASIIKPEFLPSSEKLNGHWIAGFVQGDGSFNFNFCKSSRMSQGYLVNPRLRITQHERDLIVLKRIQEYLDGCGSFIHRKSIGELSPPIDYQIADFSSIINIVLGVLSMQIFNGEFA